MTNAMQVTDDMFVQPYAPPDVEAGMYVAGVEQAVSALLDAVKDDDIRQSLNGLDALALERAMERLSIVIQEIDRRD